MYTVYDNTYSLIGLYICLSSNYFENTLRISLYAVITVYHTWMERHGGSIVNIIIDMWRGFPGMAYVY